MGQWSSVSHSVALQPMQHLNCWDTKHMDQKWISGACKTIYKVLTCWVFVWLMQWGEHVCYADWATTFHCGAIQHCCTSC